MFFANHERRREHCETVEADHDRIENRMHFVSYDVDGLSSGRRLPGEPLFPGRKAIANGRGHDRGQGNKRRHPSKALFHLFHGA